MIELVRSVTVEFPGDAQILTMAAPDMGAEDGSYVPLKAALPGGLSRRQARRSTMSSPEPALLGATRAGG